MTQYEAHHPEENTQRGMEREGERKRVREKEEVRECAKDENAANLTKLGENTAAQRGKKKKEGVESGEQEGGLVEGRLGVLLPSFYVTGAMSNLLIGITDLRSEIRDRQTDVVAIHFGGLSDGGEEPRCLLHLSSPAAKSLRLHCW